MSLRLARARVILHLTTVLGYESWFLPFADEAFVNLKDLSASARLTWHNGPALKLEMEADAFKSRNCEILSQLHGNDMYHSPTSVPRNILGTEPDWEIYICHGAQAVEESAGWSTG